MTTFFCFLPSVYYNNKAFDRKKLQNKLKSNLRVIIPLIENCFEHYGNKSLILKLLNISSKQYARWKILEQYKNLSNNELVFVLFKFSNAFSKNLYV